MKFFAVVKIIKVGLKIRFVLLFIKFCRSKLLNLVLLVRMSKSILPTDEIHIQNKDWKVKYLYPPFDVF